VRPRSSALGTRLSCREVVANTHCNKWFSEHQNILLTNLYSSLGLWESPAALSAGLGAGGRMDWRRRLLSFSRNVDFVHAVPTCFHFLQKLKKKIIAGWFFIAVGSFNEIGKLISVDFVEVTVDFLVDVDH